MVVKPGYKQTEVGVIPEEWNIEPIITCCEYADYRGKTPPKTQYGTFLITARNVRMGFIDYEESQEFVPSELYDQIMRRGKPQIGDVLITTEAPLGNVAQVDREDIALAQRIIKYRPKDSDLSSTYLKHYFLSDRFQRILNDHSSGSTAKGIKGRVLHQLPVVIPPIPEQRAIASALSDVDALLVALDRFIAKKRDLKQAVMQQLLTGQTRLPGFSGEWEVKRLEDVGEIDSAGVDKKIRSDEEPIRLVNYLDVYRRDFIYSKDLNHWVTAPPHQAKRCAVQKGDVFFTPTSETRHDIGVSAVAMEDIPDAVYSYHVARLRLREPWNLCFRAYAFKTRAFLEQAETLCDGNGTRYVISQGKFRNMTVQVPPVPEQTAIAAILSDMDAELAALEQRRDKTRALKQAMMQELLTGKTRLVSPRGSHA